VVVLSEECGGREGRRELRHMHMEGAGMNISQARWRAPSCDVRKEKQRAVTTLVVDQCNFILISRFSGSFATIVMLHRSERRLWVRLLPACRVPLPLMPLYGWVRNLAQQSFIRSSDKMRHRTPEQPLTAQDQLRTISSLYRSCRLNVVRVDIFDATG